MNINDMSVQELKALAYDLLVQQQNIVNSLQAVNQKIEEKSKKEDKKPK